MPDTTLVPDLALERRGAAMFRLVSAFESWVDRRVTTIELDDAEFARIDESIDFTLAVQVRRRLTVPGVGLLVPFTFLRRRPLRGFDLKRWDRRLWRCSAACSPSR